MIFKVIFLIFLFFRFNSIVLWEFYKNILFSILGLGYCVNRGLGVFLEDFNGVGMSEIYIDIY